jgi:hypothetical protein
MELEMDWRNFANTRKAEKIIFYFNMAVFKLLIGIHPPFLCILMTSDSTLLFSQQIMFLCGW